MTAALLDLVRNDTVEIVGPADAPLIVVLGGISASRHVVRTADNPVPGWWEDFVGPNKTIDTNAFRVLSIDYRVPKRPNTTFTTHDQAYALLNALDEAGVERAHGIVGASYGGMVALAFGEIAPDRVERLIVIGAAHESAPLATALRLLQRRIVALGLISGRVDEALVLARGVAMTTYASADEYAERFGSQNDRVRAIGDYLKSAGERFAERCTAQRFLALSEALDSHKVNPEDVRVPTTIIAVHEDQLVPISQARELAQRLGAPCRLVELSSQFGHDTFLNAYELVAPHVTQALSFSGLQS
jgi:homoserine O-acetyltransferase